MAKQYEEYKKEFEQIKKLVANGLEQIKKNAQTVAHCTGVAGEGAKEIGLRVQKLKDGGAKGATLADFLSDPEVKKMNAEIGTQLSALENELKRITALHKGEFKKTKKRFWDLKNGLRAEIATRKKQVSTKLGTGNKSLPDMEKLLKEVDKFTDAGFVVYDVYEPESFADLKRQYVSKIDAEIKSTKEKKLSQLQEDMVLGAINVRKLNSNFQVARKHFDEVMKQCKLAQQAFSARKQKELMAAKASVSAPLKQLDAMAAFYENGMKDQWVMGLVKASKDASQINTTVKNLADMRQKARTEVAKIANARLQ